MKMKKLIPALAMLLVSAILLGTSTYAWFSMNTTVTATGMQIKAVSDDTYLLISATNTTAGAIQTENSTEADVSADYLTVPEIFPASPALTAAEAGYLTTAGKKVDGTAITTAGVQVDNAAKAETVTNWFTAKAIDPTAATIKTDTARQLISFTDYAIIDDFYLTVAAGSNDAYDLTVTSTITQAGAGADVSAVKYLIVTDDGGYAAISTANNGTPVSIKGSNTALTDSTVRHVTIYIYYDGDETPVYTNNIANLTGATIDLQFDVSTTAAP